MWSHCGISYEIGQRWILAIKLLENCWEIIMKKKRKKSFTKVVEGVKTKPNNFGV